MTVEYVDAGEAINQGELSGKTAGGEIAPPVVENVTYERLLDARSEPQNWLTYYGAYDGQRYSPLDQINTENVKRIGPAWIFQAGTSGIIAGASTYSFEAAPIIVDGIMFLSGWDGWVWALDAKTGTEIWRYKHAVPFDVSLCCGNVNRGVAVAKGKVFFVTANAHVLALDATTGQRVWDRTYGDVRAGESATVAPLVVKNMVIVGSSGGEFGVRGHLDAFDVDTGEHIWRCYTVPKPGEPGSETWPADGEAWARGGGELLAHRHLRPGDEPAVRGHRQPGARLRRRGARGRQPLHRQHRRGGRRRRRDPLALPVHPARRVGLRQHRGVHPVRVGRAQAARALRQERLLLRPRPHRRRRWSRSPRSWTGSTGGTSPATAR